MDRYVLNKRAYSLTEIAIALGIISVILFTFYPQVLQILSKVRTSKISSDLNSIAHACKLYERRFNNWPSKLQDLQPYFLSPSINLKDYELIFSPNFMTVNSGGSSISVVRSTGIVSFLDHSI